MAAGRHLGFDPNGNGAVRSAVPENPTLEPNMKGIWLRAAELWPFESFHSLIGHRKPETGDRTRQVILYSVQCCYAVHWTDNKQKCRVYTH